MNTDFFISICTFVPFVPNKQCIYARAHTHTRVEGCLHNLGTNRQTIRKVPINRDFFGFVHLYLMRKNGKFRVILERVFLFCGVLSGVTPPRFSTLEGCPGGPGPDPLQAADVACPDPIGGDASRFCANDGHGRRDEKSCEIHIFVVDKST